MSRQNLPQCLALAECYSFYSTDFVDNIQLTRARHFPDDLAGSFSSRYCSGHQSQDHGRIHASSILQPSVESAECFTGLQIDLARRLNGIEGYSITLYTILTAVAPALRAFGMLGMYIGGKLWNPEISTSNWKCDLRYACAQRYSII